MNRSVESPLPVLLFGAGGLAAEIVDIAARAGGPRIVGCVVDRTAGSAAAPPSGLPVHRWDDVANDGARYAAVNAIGSPERRTFIEKAEARGFTFLTVVDPSAQIFPSAVIGSGSVIGAGTVIGAAARIGRHVFVNRGCTIGHHCEVGEFASCYAAVHVGSFSRIGRGSEIGIGAIVIDRISLGGGTWVGAGSLVTKDVPEGARVVGSPARRIGSAGGPR